MSEVALKTRAARTRAPVWLRAAVPWALAVLIILALPQLMTTSFGRTLLIEMGIAIVFAVAYNMLLGETGMLSFGHAIYFGLGGYAAVHVLRFIAAGLLLPVALLPLVGGLGGLVFGLLFGYLSTRRAGTAFAMITLGLMELVVALALIFDHLFGGEEGISGNRTSGPELFGITFGSQLHVYYLVAVWMLVSLALMRAFTRTPVGRLCNAVRDNPERVQFLGYDPSRIRLIAFAGSSFFAGVAGGLFAVNYELMAINSLGAERSALVLLMAYIGGIGSFLGPILGAVLVTFLQVALSDYTQAWLLYLGLFFVLVTLFAPNGLIGLVLMHGPIARAGLLHRLAAAYALALVPALLLAAGLIALVEINYRLAIRPELGPAMKLFGVAFDAKSATAWIVSFLLVGAGLLGLRAVAPRVAARWGETLEVARA
ncbi:MAG TPA: branched-chain amino acid ABC transporter permease [Beijerinckiaceae bacterium]|jgi:branched-chain amino acid transport system permease protein|nr:inner-rane translocator [Microvirga sp.]HZB38110.1 branched-chain amino acid ABC transporter permease [Beijerinckiaceae bacterium]